MDNNELKVQQEKSRIEELRRVMGTLPNQEPELQTKFLKGVEGITVDMVDWPTNPYKAMYIMATSCWGTKIDKWAETPPESRFEVVKAVLKRQALPLALEAFSLVFVIEGVSRACFDQMARTRIGAVFSAKGMRDNNWKGCNIRIPNALWPTKEEFNQFNSIIGTDPGILTDQDIYIRNKVENYENLIDQMLGVKQVYADIVDIGKGSWQAARTPLPLYVEYGYSAAYNFSSLLGVCSNRMKMCEMEDTVAVAWLMANEVSKRFPLLSSYLKPGCDQGRVCQYHKAYSMSEMFGCLFKECGRNPCLDSNEYSEFNETCTDSETLEQQLGIKIRSPKEWINFPHFEDLDERDKELFMQP